ncbi:unnamed protein product [Anisakis simplex]|uniref:Uncharacterized protein n=1 Tax=Anisakis simplex TaxID=6269 RepID=A0A0M3KGM1_ANISI|nr:unnamed protein product [Anisakis simplex]
MRHARFSTADVDSLGDDGEFLNKNNLFVSETTICLCKSKAILWVSKSLCIRLPLELRTARWIDLQLTVTMLLTGRVLALATQIENKTQEGIDERAERRETVCTLSARHSPGIPIIQPARIVTLITLGFIA